jgi:DNA repair exonuclease SbcCD nuclease subunit
MQEKGTMAGTFRFIHAADLHLDTSFEGVSRISKPMAGLLRDASLGVLDRLVELAIFEDAAFVVIAGDIYEGVTRGVRAQLRFQAALERLSAAGIRTFIALGNHDPLEGWDAVPQWPDGVHLFGSSSVDQLAVEREGEVLAQVYGISYPDHSVTENLSLRFQRDEQSPGIHIGVLHCAVDSPSSENTYAPCTLNDLIRADLDYWALGHIHRRQVLHQVPWVVYPGNTQGRSPKPTELGAKGACVVDVQDGAIADVRFHPLDLVRFIESSLDINDIADLHGLRSALMQHVEGLRAEHPNRALILRLELTGSGAVHEDLSSEQRMAEFHDEISLELESLDPIVCLDALKDASRPPIDFDALRRRRDFMAEVLNKGEDLAANPEELKAFSEEFLDSVSVRSIRQWLGENAGAELTTAMKDATLLAIDALGAKGQED